MGDVSEADRRPLHVVHLMASPFFGGPEKQMLGLARHLDPAFRTSFLSFAERGLARPFLTEVERGGFAAIELKHNAPDYRRALAELIETLRGLAPDVLCCSGYKPDILGYIAARRLGIPVAAVSHGWTGATWKVKLNEGLDRIALHGMDAVICVSARQSERVLAAGLPRRRVVTILNAVEPAPADGSPAGRRESLLDLFPSRPGLIVGALGRLSPEKNFPLLVAAARRVAAERADVGFVVFGEGTERDRLQSLIAKAGLRDRFILPGFRPDATRFLPAMDVFVLCSTTEGLPVALLEAFSAGVASVATDVGGVGEVLEHGRTGLLVASGDEAGLARGIAELLGDDARRRRMALQAGAVARDRFDFGAMAAAYAKVFRALTSTRRGRVGGLDLAVEP
jgi:glycosyltransferase involved in cell wall biosynthesis